MTQNEKTWKVFAEVEQDKILHFPQGMVGFPDTGAYVMLNSGSGDIICMQSVDRPEAAFLVTPWDKRRIGRQPKLTSEQQQCLQCADKSNLLWLLVLNPFTNPEWVLANLRAPVAINPDSSLGMQSVQEDPELDLHFHWMRQPNLAQLAA